MFVYILNGQQQQLKQHLNHISKQQLHILKADSLCLCLNVIDIDFDFLPQRLMPDARHYIEKK